MIDIIVHTISGRTNSTLKSIEKLKGWLDYNLIVVKNAKTPAHARNIGVSKAKSDVVAIMDDDLRFTPENFMLLLSKAKRKTCVLASGTTLVMFREDYIKLGGFEERLLRIEGDDNEFCSRMHMAGFKIILCDRKPCDLVQHQAGKLSWTKLMLRAFNGAPTDMRYSQKFIFKRFIMHLGHIHPVSFVAHLAYVLGFPYYAVRMRFGRRSEF